MPRRQPAPLTPLSDVDEISLNLSAVAARSPSSSWLFPSTESILRVGYSLTGSTSPSEFSACLKQAGYRSRARRNTQSDHRPRSLSYGRPDTSPEILPHPPPAGAAADFLQVGAWDLLANPAVNQDNTDRRGRHTQRGRRHTLNEPVPQIEITAPAVAADNTQEAAMDAPRKPASIVLAAARLLQAQNVNVRFNSPLLPQPAAPLNAPRLERPNIHTANAETGFPGRRNVPALAPAPPPPQKLTADEEAFDVLLRYGAQVEFPAQPPPTPLPVSCKVCQEVFDGEITLQQHQQLDHPFCNACRDHYGEPSHQEHVRQRHAAVPGAYQA
jgi:hypothetical protein